MHIILDEIDRRIHLHSFGQQPVARPGSNLRPWCTAADAWQALSFMNRHFREAGRLHLLRHALTLDSHDGFDLTRRNDDEMLQAAAHKVASGTWRIACEVTAVPDAFRSVPAPAMSPLLGGSSAGSARSSRRPLPPVSRAPVQAQPPTASAPATAPDWPDTAAQVAQAATLKRAAQDGTPFCEICEARRRAAAEAAA